MCGIVGAAGKLSVNEDKMVKTMLQLDTIRGPHSTGLFGARNNGDNIIFKKMGTPWEVAEYKGWDTFWRNQYNVLIGHNRWATQGGINHINAHPFHHGDIYGVHNGTLNNSTRTHLLDDAKDFDVDSENIYYHMNKNGVDATVNKLDGAFALVWFDNVARTLNLTRNSQRPLHFCYSADRKTIFWASEAWMIRIAAAKHSVEIQEVLELKVGVLFSIPIAKAGVYDAKPLGDGMVVRDLEQYRKPVVVHKKYTPKPAKPVNGNVSKLPAKKGSFSKYMNQPITFRVDGLDSDERCGMDYLDCSMEYTNIEVRYFFQNGLTDAIEDMVDNDHTYTATVRSYCDTGEGYLVLDPRTITVVEEELPEEKKRQKSLH